MKPHIAALVLCLFSGLAVADTLTYRPVPSDLYDLDHHNLYTWRVGGVNLGAYTVTGATLTFSNIRNWDGNPNMLYVHLFDTAVYGGVASFIDDNPASAPVTDIRDDFVDPRWHNGTNAIGQPAPWLIAPGTAGVHLFDESFGTTPETFVYGFTSGEIALLNTFILNGGNFALGFDPDCHFWNDGVTLRLTTARVPEPGLMALLGTAVAAVWASRRRRGARGRPSL